MKYRTRQIIVDADTFDGSEKMAHAILSEAGNGAGFDGRRVKFSWRGGVLAAERGDVVVKHGDGTMQPMRQAEFDRLYEKA